MKKFLLGLLSVMTLCNLYAQKSVTEWAELTMPTDEVLNQIYFVNQDTGFIIGNSGTILKTIDSGDSWAVMTSGTGKNLTAIDFVNDSVGYIGGYEGLLIKTEDCGETWSTISTPITFNLTSVAFYDNQNGYIGGGYMVLKCIDEGSIWDTIQYVEDPNDPEQITEIGLVEDIRCIADSAIIINFNLEEVRPTSSLYKVSNDTIWSQIYYESGKRILDIEMVNNNNWVYVGEEVVSSGPESIVYKTSDMGHNWERQSVENPNQIFSQLNYVSNFTQDIGFAVGESLSESNIGLIYHTVDGTNWVKQVFEPNVALKSVHLINENHIICIGLQYSEEDTKSKVFMTKTGGATLSLDLTETLNVNCHTFDTIMPIVGYDGQNDLTYSWSPTTGLSNANILTPAVYAETEKNYVLTVSDGALEIKDTIFVSITKQEKPNICIVTVDETTEKNKIVFEQQLLPIAYYNIYKETATTDDFEKIGELSSTELSVFVDTSSNPKVKSAKYKISIVDSCGLESELSDFHKTIHLTVNSGQNDAWNLIWDKYEGFDVPQYKIWRGISLDNMSVIDSVSGTSFTYSDLTPPNGKLYYQVEIINSENCNPSMLKSATDFSSSKSNIADNGVVSSIAKSTFYEVQLYPNPVHDNLVIDINSEDRVEFEIYNSIGILQISGVLNNNTIDLSALSESIYFIKLKIKEENKIYKAMKIN